MDKCLADKLYSEILEPIVGLDQTSVPHIKQSHLADGEDEQWCEDGLSCNGSDGKSDQLSDLDREWQKRKNQLHAIGYRDGLIAGKETSAQEGFNVGFKESVLVGFNWGLIRGVTGALDCLIVELREKIIESTERRNKFHELYESVNNLSTTDAQKSDGSVVDSYYGQLQSLIFESPAIEVQTKDNMIDIASPSQDTGGIKLTY